MTGARLVALDWGTTRCRAYLMGAGGSVLGERDGPAGSAAVAARAVAAGTPAAEMFEQAFTELRGAWLAEVPGVPVIARGMVGSNHGWAEAPLPRAPR